MAWNRKNLVVGAVAVLLIGAGATQALAQAQGQGRQRRGPGFGGFQMGAEFLVGIEQVQKELGISDEQKQSLTKIGEEAREARRGLGGGPGGQNLSDEERKARDEKREAAQAETRKKIDGVLDEKQRTRLKEIALQVRGSGALADKEVAEALGITEEQKKKLTELRNELGEKMQENFRAGRENNEDIAQIQEKNQALTKENAEKVASVLGTDQKEKLEKMKGAKFELDRSAFGRPGQGRRPARPNNNNN